MSKLTINEIIKLKSEKELLELKDCIDAVYGSDCAYFDVPGDLIAKEIQSRGFEKKVSRFVG